MNPIAYQVMHPWHWLTYGQNSAAAQVMASCIGALLVLVTLYYTMKTLRMAGETLRVAGRQAEASENAANMAIKQLALTAQAEDKATAPLIQLDMAEDGRSATLTNVGLGPALAIEAELKLKADVKVICNTDVLGNEKSMTIKFRESDVGQFGLMVNYKSTHGRPHSVAVEWNQGTGWRVEHLSHEAPFDALLDMTFRQS